jgi:hypothetical protein
MNFNVIKTKKLFNDPIWDNRKFVILLLFSTYTLFVGLRFVIFSLTQEPFVQWDEFIYKDMAYSFFKTGDFYKLCYKFYFRLPNFLYQLMLSPSFYFGDNFFIFMKLINSLEINLIIFPSFLLVKEFLNYKEAYLTAVLILFIPFINIGSQAMSESLYFPLFLFSFYFSYKLFTGLKLKYGILAGVTFALLYLTKPHALFTIFFFLMMSAIMVLFEKNNPKKRKKIILLTFLSVLCIFSSILTLNFIFSGEAGISNMLLGYSGVSGSFVSTHSLQYIFSTKFINFLLGHISSFLFVYLVPFIVTIYALFQFIREKKQGKVIFLLMVLGLFFVLFSMAIKFSLDIAHKDNLSRLHVRYYFMIFPFFIMAFACFYNEIKWTFHKKLIMGVLFVITFLINILIFLPKFSTPRGSIVDNIDMTWIRFIHDFKIFKIFFISMFIFLLGTAIYYLHRNNKRRIFYYLFFITISLIANIGHIKKAKIRNQQISKYKIHRNFIYDKIPSFSEKVFLVGPHKGKLWNISFWLPYRYSKISSLPQKRSISKKMIPGNPGWIIMFGNYKFDFPISTPIKKYKKGNCSIIRLKIPNKFKKNRNM